MILRKISKCRVNFRGIVKYSIDSNAITSQKSSFTSEEESKILEFLNDSNSQNLSKLKLPVEHVRNIQDWKKEKGEFKTLSDVLEASGFGESTLERVCDNIISSNNIVKNNSNGNKRIKQLVTPSLPVNLSCTLTSAVGIHISSLGLSWAKISKEGNNLESWNFHDFSSLPKKMHAIETFNLAISVIPRIPPADLYVFESSTALSPQGSTQSSTVASHNQLVELNCMLLSLINTSINHNMSLQTCQPETSSKRTEIENRVFYLRSKVPARLFRTLVGTERVAAIDIVTKLIENTSSAPCTPIQVDSQLRASYLSQSPANKELLGQALMLIMSFMDLCIYKNSSSIAALVPNRKRK